MTAASTWQDVLAGDAQWAVAVGDCLDVLRAMPDECVQCVVTSPPYWQLREYGTASWEGGDPDCTHQPQQNWIADSGDLGERASVVNANVAKARRRQGTRCICGAQRVDLQVGIESTPEEYIDRLVGVFREVRRVLHPTGVVFVNLGDSYASGGRGGGRAYMDERGEKAWGPRAGLNGYKDGDLLGLPWELARALRIDGWWLRSDIIHSKPNAHPESVTGWQWEPHRIRLRAVDVTTNSVEDADYEDNSRRTVPCPGCERCAPNGGRVLHKGRWRPTKAHEYVFMLAKSEDYFCDQEALREPHTMSPQRRPKGHKRRPSGPGMPEQTWSLTQRTEPGVDGHPHGRNPRSVWTIPTVPSGLKHFATMTPALARRCIDAATSPSGCCAGCGTPWTRIVERPDFSDQPKRSSDSKYATRAVRQNGSLSSSAGQAWQDWRDQHPNRTLGFRASCACNEQASKPCIVLDPFGGAGTSALEALRAGQRSIAIELNPEYATMARERIDAWKRTNEARQMPLLKMEAAQ